MGGLYTELFFAIIPTLFLCFLLICYPYVHLVTFLMFFILVYKGTIAVCCHIVCHSKKAVDCCKSFSVLLFHLFEENFRYLSGRSSGPTFRTGRTDRYLFLFQRLCLMTKKEEYGYQYKTHLEVRV